MNESAVQEERGTASGGSKSCKMTKRIRRHLFCGRNPFIATGLQPRASSIACCVTHAGQDVRVGGEGERALADIMPVERLARLRGGGEAVIPPQPALTVTVQGF